jgi:predicted esterase
LKRREFVGALAGTGLIACIGQNRSGTAPRLTARPGIPTGSISAGLTRLGAEAAGGFLQVPRSYRAGQPAPLVLGLHGAGMSSTSQLDLLGDQAESHGILILAVQSSEASWDGIAGRFGPDVERIDAALTGVFSRCRVDPARVMVEGLSDGASYALGLGLANGALFSRIVAFSPGFIAESGATPEGTPEIFVSHGRQDRILPIARTSRAIVPAMQRAGYQVTYTEFEGGHGVPPAVLQSAVEWMTR